MATSIDELTSVMTECCHLGEGVQADHSEVCVQGKVAGTKMLEAFGWLARLPLEVVIRVIF